MDMFVLNKIHLYRYEIHACQREREREREREKKISMGTNPFPNFHLEFVQR